MVTDPLADFWVHSVTVKRHAGAGPSGDIYAAPEAITGFVDHTARLITTPTGEQITATATLLAPAGTAPIPPRSVVTLPGGISARVLTWTAHTAPGLDLPEYVEVTLQ